MAPSRHVADLVHTLCCCRWEGALRDSVVPLVFIDGPSDIVSGVHLVEPFRALVASGSAAQHASAVVLDAHVGHYPQVMWWWWCQLGDEATLTILLMQGLRLVVVAGGRPQSSACSHVRVLCQVLEVKQGLFCSNDVTMAVSG